MPASESLVRVAAAGDEAVRLHERVLGTGAAENAESTARISARSRSRRWWSVVCVSSSRAAGAPRPRPAHETRRARCLRTRLDTRWHYS